MSSSGWDRTEEFFQLVQSHIPQNQLGSGVTDSLSTTTRARHLPSVPSRYGAQAESSVSTGGEETQFSRDAASIGREFSQANRKIGELQKRETIRIDHH